MFSSLLFSPHARVWNQRLLLLVTLGGSAFLAVTLPTAVGEELFTLPFKILLPTFGCILLHHVGFIINWPIPGLAIIDLILVFFETCGIAAGFHLMITRLELPTLLNFACIPLGLSFLLSIIFRIATIVRSDQRFFRQRFTFLGACTRPYPPYTPTAILLNRSVARPLVQGESVIIILARALILSCIAVGIPIFGIYAMVISPIHASVYTLSITTLPTGIFLGSPPGNVTFLMVNSVWNASLFSDPPSDFAVNQVTVTTRDRHVTCSVTVEIVNEERLVECPSTPWAQLDDWSSISINLTIAAGCVVRVMPLPTRPTSSIDIQDSPTSELVQLPDPIPMISGSHLFGQLTWTQRNALSRWVFGISTAFKPVFVADITGLQSLPSLSTTRANDATLVLYHPYFYATKLQQDSSDTTPLSGFSTFGGFWTFVEGVFVLFFGANVMYFAFGRRPLSALGLIHIFQRRALVRQWHDDFPRLRTEGSQPGSESAGIVAFIRDRLIDIGPDTKIDTANDIEA
ncbi:hypothetical protein C8R45DRAFT_1128954 [Mycena sanguinolenta]|nr:hypothetical protein C8R45DRAFT_1128954 [Mycena sanguinolenta]